MKELIEIKNFMSKKMIEKIMEEIEKYEYCDSTEVDILFESELLSFGMELAENKKEVSCEKKYYFFYNGNYYVVYADYELKTISSSNQNTDYQYIDSCSRVTFEKVINFETDKTVNLIIDLSCEFKDVLEIQKTLNNMLGTIKINNMKLR